MNNNSELISDKELTVVIDPSCFTHTMNDITLALYPRLDSFKQKYFENPSNKCILIRNIKEEYKRTEDNKITLEVTLKKGQQAKIPFTCSYEDNSKDEYAVYAHKYDEIEQIIKSQINALKINTKNIEKITIFDISHTTDKETKKFHSGFIQEKVDTLKVLNSLCPNCKHTKIASTACWGAIKGENDKNLIDEILTSINTNEDWNKQNIVEIDITPEDDHHTLINIANDNKPHVSYRLDEGIYKNAHLPTKFTRTIYLLTKNKQPKIIKQTHKFQKTNMQTVTHQQEDPYRVTEGEGGFQALSIDEIQKYTKQLENNIELEQPQKLSRKKNYLKQIYIINNNDKEDNPIIFKAQPCKNKLPPLQIQQGGNLHKELIITNKDNDMQHIITNKDNDMQQLQKLSRNNNVKQIIPNNIYQQIRPIIRQTIRPTIQNNFFLQSRQLIPHKNYLNPIQQQPRYYLQKKPIINKNNNMQQLQKLSRNNYEEKGEIVGSFKF